ncbi:hypothetical protein PF006_g30298 [Phytophthora fragariae]|uniref:Uncharacterized protein n=1 Tax=Phytophthora fragariae TaxID=53985 RepID=A0A6A3Q0K6_9STRA|nr:hypothetical protein PF006_g30298 [Phytophthora fragariae]
MCKRSSFNTTETLRVVSSSSSAAFSVTAVFTLPSSGRVASPRKLSVNVPVQPEQRQETDCTSSTWPVDTGSSPYGHCRPRACLFGVVCITASGTTLTIEPTATSADCACDTLSATVSGTSASGVVGANLWYDLTLTDSGITVATNVDGTICTGTYKSSSGTTASTPSSTKATTTTATPTTATTTTAKSSAWASSGADLLGLAMTGVAIYYQG